MTKEEKPFLGSVDSKEVEIIENGVVERSRTESVEELIPDLTESLQLHSEEITEISREINLSAIMGVIDDVYADNLQKKEAIDAFLLSPEGKTKALREIGNEAYKIVSESLAELFVILEKCGLPAKIREELLITTKLSISQKIAPSLILNIYNSIKIKALESQNTELISEINQLIQDLNTLSIRYSSLRLMTHISEYKPTLPSAFSFREDMNDFLIDVVKKNTAYSFLMVKISDPREKKGGTPGIKLDKYTTNQIVSLVKAFRLFLFMSSDLYKQEVQKNQNQSTTEEPCTDENSDDFDLDITVEDPVVETTEEDDSPTLSLQELAITEIFEGGVLSNDFLNNCREEESLSEHNSETAPGDLEILRLNAAERLREIREFNENKAYRLNKDVIIFACEIPLQEILKRIHRLFDFLDEKKVRIDYHISLTELDQTNFKELCQTKGINSSNKIIQKQTMYEALIKQLNLGISSLINLQTQVRNRYIYESIARELLLRRERLQGKSKVSIKKLEFDSTKGQDIDTISLDLLEKIQSASRDEELRQEKPNTGIIPPITTRNEPKIAIGKFVSFGDDPTLSVEKRESMGMPSMREMPQYLDFDVFIQTGKELSKRQLLK
ncbi:MAG: hypothetical protein RBS56_00885 [Candidatus Gracilibacteria bacterium]|jgi:hypothetical protein|nr:hypothetical protein [Candidatus Gracilibacteria bacterium]